MLKKFNQHKRALVLPDRSLGQKVSWGIVWGRKNSIEFGLISTSLPDHEITEVDNAIAELSEYLQNTIKRVDRINEFFNLSYEPGEPTHIQQVRFRDTRTVVSFSEYPKFEECWVVITEVDREFCVVENLFSGETILAQKGKLYGLKNDVIAKLVLHWTECEVIAADRIRLGLDLLKQTKKENKLSVNPVEEAD